MSYQREIRFAAGSVLLAMDIKNGIIQSCKIYGDFFEVKPVEELERLLEGMRYDKKELITLLKKVNIAEYIHLLSNMEFQKLLISN